MTTPTLAADVRLLELAEKATPRPWNVEDWSTSYFWLISSPKPDDPSSASVVAELRFHAMKENSEFIVAACNSAESHVKRLAALRATLEKLKADGDHCHCEKEHTPRCNAVYQLIDDALAADERAANAKGE